MTRLIAVRTLRPLVLFTTTNVLEPAFVSKSTFAKLLIVATDLLRLVIGMLVVGGTGGIRLERIPLVVDR